MAATVLGSGAIAALLAGTLLLPPPLNLASAFALAAGLTVLAAGVYLARRADSRLGFLFVGVTVAGGVGAAIVAVALAPVGDLSPVTLRLGGVLFAATSLCLSAGIGRILWLRHRIGHL